MAKLFSIITEVMQSARIKRSRLEVDNTDTKVEEESSSKRSR